MDITLKLKDTQGTKVLIRNLAFEMAVERSVIEFRANRLRRLNVTNPMLHIYDITNQPQMVGQSVRPQRMHPPYSVGTVWPKRQPCLAAVSERSQR
ncbi:hypothetical protein HDU85_003101 [Gaertneriomyces sp. JEL0708]|nr:hypothetical protein HDU85_003101 [Gaertneriomyces sp. JEL0708]